jgi:hypothetical protein
MRCDKYASGEAWQDNCEAYLSFCESNDTLPRVMAERTRKAVYYKEWKVGASDLFVK